MPCGHQGWALLLLLLSQVVTPGGCGVHEEGEWYDVISAPVDNCTVRMRLVDYSGRTVMHCHILSHEDMGTMGWVNVTGGPALDYQDIAPVQGVTLCHGELLAVAGGAFSFL